MTIFAELAGGSWIFALFLVVLVGAIVFGYYSKTGSEITQRPYQDRGDTDTSSFRDTSQDVRNWSHGTGGSHRRNKPAPPTPEELKQALDPETQERLAAWRAHLAKGMPPGLVAPPDPSRDHTLGPQDAPVTIVAYGDFQCPSCREADWEVRAVLKERPDDLAYVFRHFPIADAHPGALDAAQACEYAATRDSFWEMHDKIYRASRPPTREALLSHARQLKLDPQELEQVLDDRRYAQRIAEDFDTGVRSGVDGTPTLFVNGVRHDDDMDRDTLRTAVEAQARTA
ncbi:MAG TPA: thioredoxin domain-containing protein [Solirubrobacteraceae bacterium]|jgi:protein-disulfide isomerase